MSEEFEPYVVHRQTSPHYELLADNVYYPISHRALRELIGVVLTHIDAMGLPERTHKAAKTLIVRDAWRWWDGVHENATTSGAGCLAPVVLPPDHSPWSRGIGAAAPDLIGNRWGWASEDEYLASVMNVQESAPSAPGPYPRR
jgi:hypothetical protein